MKNKTKFSSNYKSVLLIEYPKLVIIMKIFNNKKKNNHKQIHKPTQKNSARKQNIKLKLNSKQKQNNNKLKQKPLNFFRKYQIRNLIARSEA